MQFGDCSRQIRTEKGISSIQRLKPQRSGFVAGKSTSASVGLESTLASRSRFGDSCMLEQDDQGRSVGRAVHSPSAIRFTANAKQFGMPTTTPPLTIQYYNTLRESTRFKLASRAGRNAKASHIEPPPRIIPQTYWIIVPLKRSNHTFYLPQTNWFHERRSTTSEFDSHYA